MFFCSFLSLGFSLRSLMTRADSEGTTSVWASLFWMVIFTVILRPFCSLFALMLILPSFFRTQSQEDQSWGSVQTWHWLHPCAPEVYDFDFVGDEFGHCVGYSWCWMNLEVRQIKKVASWTPLRQKPKMNIFFITNTSQWNLLIK